MLNKINTNMKKSQFLTTVAAAIAILMASCGQNASKKTMNDEQIADLKKEIFYTLPEIAMPDDLKTKEQRNNVVYGVEDEIRGIIAPNSPEHINCLSYYNFGESGNHTEWEMAIYVTNDCQNVIVLVQYTGGYDEASGLIFYKTLNYNIKSKEFTEVEFPMDLFSSEELFQVFNINDRYIEEKAKDFFNNQKEIYYEFYKDGFTAEANITMFWYDGDEEIFDYYNEHAAEIYANDAKPACRKWNGSRFVKEDRLRKP